MIPAIFVLLPILILDAIALAMGWAWWHEHRADPHR
jgi:hypothetical protein